MWQHKLSPLRGKPTLPPREEVGPVKGAVKEDVGGAYDFDLWDAHVRRLHWSESVAFAERLHVSLF